MQPTQTPAFTRSDVQIRAARADDRVALEAIAGQIWEGHDYLPRVLDEWVTDEAGGFWVATVHDRVIGAIKLTRFAEGEWWMEGLRVDPAYQGLGFGRIMHHFVINQLRQRGAGEVRFSTASLNGAVLQLARETGFQRTAIFLPYGGDPLAEPVQQLQPLGPDDLARVQAWINASRYVEAVQRSVERNWSYYRLTEIRLRGYLADGLVYGWPGSDGALGGVIMLNPTDKDRWPEERALKIGYLDVPEAALAEAVRDLRRLAAAEGRVRMRVKVLNEAARVAAVEAGGLVRDWEGEVWLFARPISLTEGANALYDTPPNMN
ncbi:MAG: GNAT family N-acetyltransferase [Anaerolineae bacterium]|nr:GNAT family N-acetyltransferase [Anaerolineae bacterium]